MIRSLFIAALLACLASSSWAAEYMATWDRYTHSSEVTLVGFKLWRGTDPYTLVAEFPYWARGGRWTQDEPIASGDVFSLTAVFAGPIGVWADAACSDSQYTDQTACAAAAAPLGMWTAESCSDAQYTNQVDCENNSETWTPGQCSDPEYTTESSCEALSPTWAAAHCSTAGYTTEAECEGTESHRSEVYVYPMGDGTSGIRYARFKIVAGVAAAPLTNQTGARLR